MTARSDLSSGSGSTTVYSPPADRPPPVLAVGALAWFRANLFRSTFDSILTLVAAFISVSVIVGILQWSISSANWFVVIKNWRFFMVGRFPLDALWQADVFVLLLAFAVGVTLAAVTRIHRRSVMVMAVILFVLYVVPFITRQLPPAPAYLAAGNSGIAAGSITETPQAALGFIGRAGEVITVNLPDSPPDDAALATLTGFTDRATSAVVNNATNRLTVQDTIAALQTRLQSDLLTENQRQTLTDELNGLQVPEPVGAALAINTASVRVAVLDSQLNELASATLDPGGFPFSVSLPADGWYILQKTTSADEPATSILETTGIYPMIVNTLSATDIRYNRMTDDFITGAARPQIDGRDVEAALITDNQYRGQRPFTHYLRLQLGPFFDLINDSMLWVTLAAAAGYLLGRVIDNRLPAKRSRQNSRRLAWVLWMLSPAAAVVLLASVDTSRWGGLLLTFMLTAVGIVASFPLGVLLALGRRSSLPAIKWACILFIELVRGVPLISVLFMAQLLLPLINPGLSNVENVVRAMIGITLFSAAYLAENVRGGLQSIPHGQEEAAKALGLASIQITLFIMLPQALRAVIPALVGQCISLFKDTSLVAIVGLLDLTKIADSTIAQPEYIGLRRETFIFISVIYFIFSYIMAAISRRLETSGVGAVRRY